MKKATFVFLSMFYWVGAIGGGPASETLAIDVEVVDAQRANCPVFVAVYREPKSWLGDAPFRFGKQRMQGGVARLAVRALTPGKYALFAFCDQNGNGKLDEDVFGIPKEPFGFSNGLSGESEPSFEEAAITVRSGAKASWQIVLVRP